jgi:hypothetical protein
VSRQVGSYTVSWTGKEFIEKFTESFRTIWDERQMSFIVLKEFLHDYCEYLAQAYEYQLKISVTSL